MTAMASGLPETSVAETLAEEIVALQAGALPAATARKCVDLLIDVVGLCVTARNEDYIRSALTGCDDDAPCTAIGHRRTLNAAGAAFVTYDRPVGDKQSSPTVCQKYVATMRIIGAFTAGSVATVVVVFARESAAW